MNVKLLAEHHLEFLILNGGFTFSSEPTLVKMTQCWKSHVATHLLYASACYLVMLFISFLRTKFEPLHAIFNNVAF